LPPKASPGYRLGNRRRKFPLLSFRFFYGIGGLNIQGISVNITARHFAAAQYTVMAAFVVASWYTMLTPWERALGQLEFIFAPSYEKREFFIWLAITNSLTVVVALAFWSKRAASYPLAPLLVCAFVGLLAWAIWSSNTPFIFAYSLGCMLSIWSWWQPNKSFKRDALKRAP
jgi:hypothetical protein